MNMYEYMSHDEYVELMTAEEIAAWQADFYAEDDAE